MSASDRLMDLFTKNRALKMLAVILAFATWFTIRDATSFQDMVQNVPVEITVAGGWAVQSRSINTVNVMVRGSESQIRFLDKDDVRIELEVRPTTNGTTQIIQIGTENVVLPKGIRAAYIDPPEIALTLDRESERRVPVQADILGQPPDGYDVESVVVSPSDVVIHGPERRIGSIEVIRTAPLDLEGRLRSFQLNRAVLSPGENWTARIEPSQVRVEVSIVERSMRMDFTNVPVNALLPAGSSASVMFFPSTVNVAMKGRSDAMTNIQPASVKAFVDAEQLAPGDRKDLPVRVPTASGVDIIGIDPPTVRAEMDYVD